MNRALFVLFSNEYQNGDLHYTSIEGLRTTEEAAKKWVVRQKKKGYYGYSYDYKKIFFFDST